MNLEDIQKDISNMSNEEILDMIKQIRSARAETPKIIKKKEAKKSQSKEKALLELLASGKISAEKIKEMYEKSKG